MNYEICCGSVVFNDNKVIIIKHKYGHISFPKGHVEGNETEEETAIREVKEETGIDIEITSNKKYYVQYENDNNSIVVEINFKYEDGIKTIRGEKIFNGEIHNFISYYGNIKFKCTKIEYHDSTKKVKKIYIEEI